MNISMDVSEEGDTSTSSMNVVDDVTNDDDIDEKKIEKLWAKERYEMSHGEREAATDELHGVKSRYNTTEYESPENHFKALVQFDSELNNPNSEIPSRLKCNYLRALRMNSSYVTSSDYRLRFLRAEFFDVSKAIVRFCKCLNFMVEVFGDISLLRQIFLSDLNKTERKLLKEGAMQLSPSRDSLGRRSLFFLGACGANYSTRERNRVGLYLIFQVLAEDVTTQRNGLVTIHLMSEDVWGIMGGANKPQFSNLFLSVFESCPLRFSAIHICFPEKLLYRLLKPLVLLLVGNEGRKTMRVHSGTTMEINYSLSSFGVRLDDIPMTYSGTIKTRQHMRWMKVRAAVDQYIEEQCKGKVDGDFRHFYASDQYDIQPIPHIQCPEINCVLFHKNGVAWEFPGNIKFRAFLDEQLPKNYHLHDRYSGNPKAISTGISNAHTTLSEKEGLYDRIIRLSFAQNVQFLLYDDTKHWYIDLKEPDVLRKYIGFAIRGRQRRVSAQQHSGGNNNTQNNATNNVFINMDGEQHNCGSDVSFSSDLMVN